MQLTNGSLGLALAFSALTLAVGAMRTQAAGFESSGVEPNITRQTVVEPNIDQENIEITTYFGAMNIDDFGVNPIYGVRGAYHLTPAFFIEFSYGVSQADKTSFETLQGVDILTPEQRDYQHILGHFNWNFMPGETFVTEQITLTSQLYANVGLGSIDFAGQTESAMSFGLGYRALINDWLALRLDFRDHVFAADLFGEQKRQHNFEASSGFSVFF